MSNKLRGGIFQHHAARAQLQRFDDLALFRRRGQQNHPHRSRVRRHAQVAQGFQTRMLGHGQIEQKNVGLQLPRQLHRFGAIRGFPQNLQVCLRLQQPPQTVAENRMVVGNHKADWLRLF